MVDENAKLFVLQQQLEKDTQGRINFFGLSVNETIRTCLINGMSKKADNVKDTFKVPDKRYATVSLDPFGLVLTTNLVSGTSNCTR
jgi:vacuolar protein sorting-associated protein 16